MRLESVLFLRRLWLAVATLTLVPLSRLPTALAQNNGHSQVMILPDPTPRQLDPRLLFPSDNPNHPVPANRDLAMQSERRRQLIVWAANELVLLSDRAEKAAAAPPSTDSKAAVAVNMNKIETLSKSLAAALKAK